MCQNICKEKHDSKIDASGINAIADNREYRKHFIICLKQIFAHEEKNIERRIITMQERLDTKERYSMEKQILQTTKIKKKICVAKI